MKKIMYHGSNIRFEVFDYKKIGTNGLQYGLGFYVADYETATHYADGDNPTLFEIECNLRKKLPEKTNWFTYNKFLDIIEYIDYYNFRKYNEGEYIKHLNTYTYTIISDFIDDDISKLSYKEYTNSLMKIYNNFLLYSNSSIDILSEFYNLVGNKYLILKCISELFGYTHYEPKINNENMEIIVMFNIKDMEIINIFDNFQYKLNEIK